MQINLRGEHRWVSVKAEAWQPCSPPLPSPPPLPLRTHSRAPEIKIQQPHTTSMDKTCGNMLTHSRYFKPKDAFYDVAREGEFLFCFSFQFLAPKKTILRTFLHVFSRRPSAPPARGLIESTSGTATTGGWLKLGDELLLTGAVLMYILPPSVPPSKIVLSK